MTAKLSIDFTFPNIQLAFQAHAALAEVGIARGGSFEGIYISNAKGSTYITDPTPPEPVVPNAAPVEPAPPAKRRASKKSGDAAAGETTAPETVPETVAAEQPAAQASERTPAPEAVSWPELVEVLNKVNAKGYSVVKSLLTKHGIERAIELKSDDNAAKRIEIFVEAQEIVK